MEWTDKKSLDVNFEYLQRKSRFPHTVSNGQTGGHFELQISIAPEKKKTLNILNVRHDWSESINWTTICFVVKMYF